MRSLSLRRRFSISGIMAVAAALFLVSAVVPSFAADKPLSEVVRFGPDLLGVKSAAKGTRDSGGSGRLTLNLPGEPVAAFLYIVGFDYHVDGYQFPKGDKRIKVKVVNGNGDRKVFRRVPIAYRYPKDKGFINRLDITDVLSPGKNRIRVSGYDLDHPDGMVALAVYRDETLTSRNIISIHEGADLGWYEKRPSKGPDTEVVTFDFEPWNEDRQGRIRLFFGDTEAGRGDEIFLYTNTGTPRDWLMDTDGDNRLDIVDRRFRLTLKDTGRLKNDPANRRGRLEAIRGAISLEEDKLGVSPRRGGFNRKAQLDAFLKEYTIPASHEFASFQAQSEDPEDGDSLLLFLAIHEMGEVLPPPTPVIDVTKTPEPASGCAPLDVQYTVTVFNPGPDMLRNVVVTDDPALPFTYSGGDLNSNGMLDVFETWSYTAPANYQEGGIYNDTVTVDAIGVESGEPVQGTAKATVNVSPKPVIAVTKTATPEIGAVPLVVNYEATISNPGLAPLHNVRIEDNTGLPFNYGSGDDGDGILQPGEVWTYTAVETYTVPGVYQDTVTVWGGSEECGEASAEASASIEALDPAIDIEKATNGEDADDPTGPFVPVGDPVLWTYVVTNVGDADLANVIVTDDRGETVSCPRDALAVGESMTCTASGTAAPGQYANVGSVVGTDPEGTEVRDSDPSHYFGVEPGIRIEKSTNGVDADDPNAGDAPQIAPGDTVTWEYVVTNVGTMDLTNVTVTDDQGVSVSCPKSTLAVGESMTCTASGAAENVATYVNRVPGKCGEIPGMPLYENMGLATGEYTPGRFVRDKDASHYCNRYAELTLIKHVVNNYSGTAVAADFTLTATGPAVLSGAGGASSIVPVGTYALSETTLPGYVVSSGWSCTGGQQSGDSVTLSLGESVTCEITNTDIPTRLTLIKHVINDNGGTAVTTDFTLTAADLLGLPAVQGPGGATALVFPDTYTLSETGPTGYTAGGWSCSGTGDYTHTGDEVTLAAGADVTCEITNDDTEECSQVCEGKLTSMTMVWHGSPGSSIALRITAKKGSNEEIVFDQIVVAGVPFTVIGGPAGSGGFVGTLGTDITIEVDGSPYSGVTRADNPRSGESYGDLETSIHTSCSDPRIRPGFWFGDFELTSVTSSEAGLICR